MRCVGSSSAPRTWGGDRGCPHVDPAAKTRTALECAELENAIGVRDDGGSGQLSYRWTRWNLTGGDVMTIPTAASNRAGTDLDRIQSRERAVSRVLKGVIVTGIGWAGIIAVPVADFIFGLSQPAQEVLSIGARSLVWIGLLVAATAGTHLLRFGGRRGVLAFGSFAGAGAFGLLAVAEQLETWFLDTHVLTGLDRWSLAGAVILFLAGWMLLPRAPHGDSGEP